MIYRVHEFNNLNTLYELCNSNMELYKE